MSNDPDVLREQVLKLLDGGHAHLHYDDATADLPFELMSVRPAGATPGTHTAWGQVEHLRITQRDLLDYVRTPGYESPAWPEGYWPDEDGPADAGAWERSRQEFRADSAAFRDIVADGSRDLLAAIPHAGGTTLLRNALVVADHNAYHLGQLVMLRRALGAWHEG